MIAMPLKQPLSYVVLVVLAAEHAHDRLHFPSHPITYLTSVSVVLIIYYTLDIHQVRSISSSYLTEGEYANYCAGHDPTRAPDKTWHFGGKRVAAPDPDIVPCAGV